MNSTTEMNLLVKPDSSDLRFLPEGPYAVSDGIVSWVAIQHGSNSTSGSLNLLDLNRLQNDSFALPGRPGFAFPTTKTGVFIVGCERELGLFNTHTNEWSVKFDKIDDAVDNTIINDGLVFEDNLIFGCKDLEFATKKAGLYLYRGADKKLVQLRDDQICSNGKSILKINGEIYLIDIDSPTKQIARYRLDISAGKLEDRVVIVDLRDDPAVPDGMCLSSDAGSLFVSMYNPEPANFGETRQYSIATGEVLHIFKTERSPRNTCPQIVRHDSTVKLIVTTAIEHMSTEEQTNATQAGCLFQCDLTETLGITSASDTPAFPIEAI